MKTLITAVALALLVGCGPVPRDDLQSQAGGGWCHFLSHQRSGEICLNGVVYYTGTYSLAPKFKQDSTVETCN
jgi:hypothetical protein